jgi:hypothetical protein
MPAMPTVVLAGLIVFVVAVAAGLAVAAREGLRAWRAQKRLRRSVLRGLSDVTAGLATLELRSAQLPERLARLDAARASLEESLAGARIVARGAGEFTALVHGVRSFIPSR